MTSWSKQLFIGTTPDSMTEFPLTVDLTRPELDKWEARLRMF